MNTIRRRLGFKSLFTSLLLSALVAGCGDPVLGTGGIAVLAPTVTAVSPANNAIGVSPANPGITATFSEPMAAITGDSSFELSCAAPCVNPTGSVSLDATYTIATFVLTSGTDLAQTERYTVTITGARSRSNGLAMERPYIWGFVTADTVRPRVTFTVPATSSPGPTAGVPVNTAITAAFTEDMAPASIIAAGTFTLSCAAPCVAPTGVTTYVVGSRAAVFTPNSALAPATTYTATVTAAATDLAGNALAGNQAALPSASDYIWSFTTGAVSDTTRPRVTSTVPVTTSPGPTTGVSVNTGISATFTEAMAPATIVAAGTFTVTCSAPCVSPSGDVSYVVGSRTAIFTPAAALASGATYTAVITTAAEDLAGNQLGGNQAALPAASNYLWSFTTGPSTDTTAPTVLLSNPADTAVGVCINKTINATFSEPMDGLTITASTFTLKVTGGASVTGVVAYDAGTRIATFNPGSDLLANTDYTATIKGGANGVKDLAGNPLAADAITKFSTNSSTCTVAPVLGAAAPFGSFGGNATVTNDGLDTVINGDVGVNAASTTVTGLRDSGGNVYTVTPNNDGLVNGLIYTLTAPPGSVAGAAVTQARSDAQLAFDSISPGSLPGGIDMSSLAQCPSCGGAGGGADELGGRTLPPGVYLSATGLYDLSGPARGTGSLTLDAGGDANAVWVFQTAAGTGKLNVGLTGPSTPAVPIKVLLINGAQVKNVFWYLPAGAIIGTGATMVGTILSDASITFSTTGGSPPTAVITTLDGRAIALTSAVTMTNTVINVPAP